MKAGNRGVFFSLEYTDKNVRDLFRGIGIDVVVIDYLQLLHQQRDKPSLADQFMR